MSVINLLIALCILAAICYFILWIFDEIPPKIQKLIIAIFMLIGAGFVLKYFGYYF